jgi:hypothetical protein
LRFPIAPYEPRVIRWNKHSLCDLHYAGWPLPGLQLQRFSLPTLSTRSSPRVSAHRLILCGSGFKLSVSRRTTPTVHLGGILLLQRESSPVKRCTRSGFGPPDALHTMLHFETLDCDALLYIHFVSGTPAVCHTLLKNHAAPIHTPFLTHAVCRAPSRSPRPPESQVKRSELT